MTVKTYDNVEELLADIAKARQAADAADAAVGPESAQFKEGGHYARFHPSGLIVYGEIRDPIQEDIDDGADEAEVEYQRRLWARPDMKYYLYTKSYSKVVPEGEYGNVHVSAMDVPLTKEEFELAKELEWPTEVGEFFEKILKLRRGSGGSA